MSEVDVKKITTEGRNPNTMDIDVLPTIDILKKFNDEDKTVAYAVEKALPQVAKVVDIAYQTFINGGRLIYMGAGTSGRMGVMDSVECPPTFSVDRNMIQCLMAGGSDAFVVAHEGAEDDPELAKQNLKDVNLTPKDFVIGIAASGRTPFVLGGIEYAKEIGCHTAGITTCLNTVLEKAVEFPIVAYTGAEAITGSTRLKSGTAQKMICNMISSASMIKMGKVYENLMIDVKATNEKLVARSHNILCQITGCTTDEAKAMLVKYGTIKKSIFAYFTGCEELAIINQYLDKNYGNIRASIMNYQEDNK